MIKIQVRIENEETQTVYSMQQIVSSAELENAEAPMDMVRKVAHDVTDKVLDTTSLK